MTLFALVKIVLDELYVEASHMFGADVDAEIIKRIAYLAAVYANLTTAKHEPIDYKDPATRFAYVYKYVPAHGDYAFQFLKDARTALTRPLFPEQEARISCIGGGPGSDLIGVLKFIESRNQYEPVTAMTAYLLDREHAWSDSWAEVNKKLKMAIQFHSAFQPFDVTVPTSWESQKKFLQADLFTLSYFVSEVMALDHDGRVSKFWNTLLTGAKLGACMLFLDNGDSRFTDYFDARWLQHGGWELVDASNGIYITPSSAEQASELAVYSKKFNHMPKIKGTVSSRFLRKLK